MLFNKFKKHNLLVICLIIVLTFNFLFFPIFQESRVKASDTINKEEVYKGIGIAVLLVLISKLGEHTEASIKINNSKKNVNFDDLPKDEMDILARAIHAEARGEPYIGQVAVGAVILNRVESSSFPDTIREVVFQEKQFSSVNDGQIYLEPNNAAYKAAKEALDGRDPSYGAMYFYNPKTAKTLWWLSTRETTRTIGNHVFAE